MWLWPTTKHLAHFIKNTEMYFMYHHSAWKYWDMIFHPYHFACVGVSLRGAACVDTQMPDFDVNLSTHSHKSLYDVRLSPCASDLWMVFYWGIKSEQVCMFDVVLSVAVWDSFCLPVVHNNAWSANAWSVVRMHEVLHEVLFINTNYGRAGGVI